MDATAAAGKVTREHLQRDAYLYIRQSTLKQVINNTESTQRQYALRGRAIALGWDHSQIIVIDTDQGQSGASAEGRDGFQRLVAEVGMGHAGIVLGLEVSRLARNNTDWHRLLEICALAGTLILDEDGLYDPGNFNDRLLLGLKGTMSEAECTCSRPVFGAECCPKRGAGSWSSRCPSASSMTTPSGWSSTRTPRSSKRSGICWPRSPPPAPPTHASRRSPTRA
ncbi:recombinase family protein [Streptomyces sp. NPDC054841]